MCNECVFAARAMSGYLVVARAMSGYLVVARAMSGYVVVARVLFFSAAACAMSVFFLLIHGMSHIVLFFCVFCFILFYHVYFYYPVAHRKILFGFSAFFSNC